METELRLSALQAGQASAAETGEAPSAPSAERVPPPADAPAAGAAPAARERRGDSGLQENPLYRPAGFRAAAPEEAPGPPHEAEGFDGRELRNVQVELRGLRADVAELARALGKPVRTQSSLTEYRGILQQYDGRDSDVQRMRFEDARAQQPSPEHQLERAARQAEGRQLTRKQEELLQALRRAERRLEEAPEQVLPPGVREAVIGEILRARYSAALFGGVSAGALITGRLANMAA